MPFEDYEREVRSVLNSLLGPGGFDAARDILAITVNRWPHGYARDHVDLEDADWNTEPAPETVGRSASATSRSRTPTPPRMPTRMPRSTRRGGR